MESIKFKFWVLMPTFLLLNNVLRYVMLLKNAVVLSTISKLVPVTPPLILISLPSTNKF
jgi:hypothetical protein